MHTCVLTVAKIKVTPAAALRDLGKLEMVPQVGTGRAFFTLAHVPKLRGRQSGCCGFLLPSKK